MDIETEQKLVDLEAKLDSIDKKVGEIKKYMTLTFWVTVVVIVLPLVGMVFIVPIMLSSLTSAMGI